MSLVIIGACGSFLALAATKPKNLISDSRLGIILLSLMIGGLVEYTALTEMSTKIIQASLTCWVVLWSMSYWDNSRGELAPRWRALGVGPIGVVDQIMFFLQPLVLAYGLSLLAVSFIGVRITLALVVLPAFTAVKVLFGRPASFPGFARDHKITRKPSWSRLKKKHRVEPGWMFAEAEESHKITQENVNNGFRLTGEPAGRQIWHFKSGMKGGEDQVGGEGPEYTASENPNTCDVLFRRQMTQRKSVKLPVRSKLSRGASDLEKAKVAAKFGVAAYCRYISLCISSLCIFF